MENLDILCVGHASFDLTMSVDHHPAADEKTFASSLTACGGGPAANAAVTASRLGFKAGFAGYVGNDLWGEQQVRELRAEGVNTEFILRGEDATPISVILTKPDGQRTLVNYNKNTGQLPARHVKLSYLTPKIILFDGHEPALSLALVKQARKRNIPTMLDAGSLHKGTLALKEQVEYLICSQKFALQFTRQDNPLRALHEMSWLAPYVVITLSNYGLVWKSPGATGNLPAFEVSAIDTTGAGDVFHGALAVRIAIGGDWEESLLYASAAAALSCTRLGARTSIPKREEVDKFLQERGIQFRSFGD
jgi:sulfofructose kinase